MALNPPVQLIGQGLNLIIDRCGLQTNATPLRYFFLF
jgi:hypothetical protein